MRDTLTPAPRFRVTALLAVFCCLVSSAPVVASDQPAAVTADAVKGAKQAGNIAWMLVATALVMLMMPGLALFYGGMVRRKNVLGTMMHTMIALGIVGVQWVVVGYAIAFGATRDGYYGWDPALVLLGPDVAGRTFPGTDIPVYLHAMFQGMFAIITVALISGAFAERVRFGPYCLFVLLWTTLVYDPLAHWVWGVNWTPNKDGGADPAGWLGVLGALDFAGGTVVHIAAGAAGLAAVVFLRPRHGFPGHAVHPNGLVLTLLGAGLLWFGWFGFNAGSATASNVQAVSALTVTQVAAAAAGLGWVFVEWLHRGKPTALGFASGVVAGLVAITPASGFVAPGGAILIGVIAGVACYLAVLLKPAFGYDDSLDAFGIHGVGGFIGAILTGALVSLPLWRLGTGNSDTSFPGVTKDGTAAQLWVQFVAAASAAAYSFLMTAILVIVLDKTIGFTVTPEEEADGLDRAVHGEVGFDYAGAVLEEVSTTTATEPKSAAAPPTPEDDGQRFTLVVEGPDPEEVRRAWVALCEPRTKPPSDDFRAVYRNVTTVSGNRFRFRGGNHVTMKENLQKLLQEVMDGTAVRVHSDI